MKKLIWILLILLLVIQPQEKHMALEFDGTTTNQHINFGSILTGLTRKSIVYWVNLDSNPNYYDVLGRYHPFTGWGTYTHANDPYYFNYWSTTPGSNVIWATTGDFLTTGTWHQVIITYDNSSASNDALIYVDGVSRAVTRAQTPSGVPLEDTADPIRVGAIASANVAIDGKLTGLLVYNRILSATEILSAYNSRKAIPSYNGLVFAPNLLTNGAIKDRILGTTGTFSGSPAFAPESILSYGGL